MQLRVGTFSEMADCIKSHNSKIVMFGAGVIGTSTTPAILHTLGLESSVVCCIDNDAAKWGKEIHIGSRTIRICAPDVLYTLGENVVVLINISRYSEVLEQLEQMQCTNSMQCYIMPMIFMYNFHSEGGKGVIQTCSIPIIPKKIHYIWFGGKKLSQSLQQCIDSWHRYCPDYEIVRWDESNYDIGKCLYMKQAYKHKRYGFVPDYARIDILYQYGGIYMDTDVELVRNLDSLLYQEAFSSMEKWQVINFGGCSGSVAGHPSLEPFLKAWRQRKFIRDDGTMDILSSGYVDTRVALDNGYVLNGQNQTIMGMNIYTYDYFHPYDYMSGKTEMTNDTFAIHHFNGGWLDERMQLADRKTRLCFENLCQRAGFIHAINSR
ncbi:MAG: hypothetical protein K2N34_10380 [Lachnospiraceae bacterium]|nr:hypothetical protein [Lachnospiraceae bacterium]